MHKSLRDLMNEDQLEASQPPSPNTETTKSDPDDSSPSAVNLCVNPSQTTIETDEKKENEKETLDSFIKESATNSKDFIELDAKSLSIKIPPLVSRASFGIESFSSLNVECTSQGSVDEEENEDDVVEGKVPSGGSFSSSSNGVRLQGGEGEDGNVAGFSTLKSCQSVGEKSLLERLNVVNGEIVKSGELVSEAWERLKSAYVYFKGKPVGTLAALDTGTEALNYNQVFVRDFFPSGLACLMKKNPEPEIVKNFLLKTLHLPGWEKRIDNFTLGEGVMPASFKIICDQHCLKETLVADFGGTAIGRVAPVDSGFWWIMLLWSYGKCTHDLSLQESSDVQRGMKLILNLCLSDGFDTFPTLLCADGCSMIDRRMGIYGYPIEIQALFFFALRCARHMIKPEREGKELIERIDKRIAALSFHIKEYYWLDFAQLNNIYRYKTEEYSRTAVNKFNVIPDSIPDWLFEFMPSRGGYLIGNVSPARMDFRWFLVGNCVAILSSLVTSDQAAEIMDLIEERWDKLIGEMPLKIVYPALEGHEWRIVTGFDPKNTCWSYHNGGSWPVLIWLLTAACVKTGRPLLAKRAIEMLEKRLSKDGWPEYYDGKLGKYIGKQARKHQTWTIAGYLVAKLMIENPANIALISMEEDKNIAKPRLTRSASF